MNQHTEVVIPRATRVLLIWWCIPCAHRHLDISGYLIRHSRYALPYHEIPSLPLFFLLFYWLLVRDIVIHYSILQHHEFPWDDILIVCYAAATAAAGSQPFLYAAGGGGSNTRGGGIPSRYNSMCNVWTLLECLMKSCLISNNGLESYLPPHLNLNLLRLVSAFHLFLLFFIFHNLCRTIVYFFLLFFSYNSIKFTTDISLYRTFSSPLMMYIYFQFLFQLGGISFINYGKKSISLWLEIKIFHNFDYLYFICH